MQISLIVFDIDGVLTDGSVLVDEDGNERKRISLKSLDAIGSFRQEGYLLAAITGEETALAMYFERRISWDCFLMGRKDKGRALEETMSRLGVASEETLYIGDGIYDVEALKLAGVGVCPSDACVAAKAAADVVLKESGGGCIDELFYLVQQINTVKSAQVSYLMRRIAEHIQSVQQISFNLGLQEQIMVLCEDAAQTAQTGGKLLLCGNGGSAADAQHIAAEFVGRFFLERKAISAEALTTNTSILTCLGNDYSFDSIFARQVESLASAGDLLIGLSTSGQSKNVLEAFRKAKEMGVRTALLMGGFAAPACETNHLIQVPSQSTPRIQEMHILIGHILAEFVEAKLYKKEGE